VTKINFSGPKITNKQEVKDHEYRNHAIDALLKLRSKQKPITALIIKKARQKGRK
jgi:hypothetical protein